MKLIIAVVKKRDMRVALHDALIEGGFRFTEIGSTGGFLGPGSVTLLLGVEGERVDEAIKLIRANCRSREEAVSLTPPDTRLYADIAGPAMTVPVGGAQVFVLNIERVEHV